MQNINPTTKSDLINVHGRSYPQQSSIQSRRQMTMRTTKTRSRVNGTMFSSQLPPACTHTGSAQSTRSLWALAGQAEAKKTEAKTVFLWFLILFHLKSFIYSASFSGICFICFLSPELRNVLHHPGGTQASMTTDWRYVREDRLNDREQQKVIWPSGNGVGRTSKVTLRQDRSVVRRVRVRG